jgi:hypothetical protein
LALALSFLVFIIQAGTLFLVSKDILDHGDSIFGQFTTRVVRWAQLIAILITILSQTDIISAVDVWINGRPGRGNIVKPLTLADDTEKHTEDTPVYEFEPNAVLWHVSNLLRFVEGFVFCLPRGRLSPGHEQHRRSRRPPKLYGGRVHFERGQRRLSPGQMAVFRQTHPPDRQAPNRLRRKRPIVSHRKTLLLGLDP